MTFTVTRTSHWGDSTPPCDDAYPFTRETWRIEWHAVYSADDLPEPERATWYTQGRDHETDSRGFIQRKIPWERKYWRIDIDSLDDLIKFQETHGPLVLRTAFDGEETACTIEIYDDYRE